MRSDRPIAARIDPEAEIICELLEEAFRGSTPYLRECAEAFRTLVWNASRGMRGASIRWPNPPANWDRLPQWKWIGRLNPLQQVMAAQATEFAVRRSGSDSEQARLSAQFWRSLADEHGSIEANLPEGKARFARWVLFHFAAPEQRIGLDPPKPSDAELTEFVVRLFREPRYVVERFSLQSVAEGLRELISESGDLATLIGRVENAKLAESVAESISQLFAKLFAPACTESLGHRAEGVLPALNTVCYMWWDIFPTWGDPGKPQFKERDLVLLEAMRQCLRMNSLAVMESALHGLGHWHLNYDVKTMNIIDEWLEQVSQPSKALREYAIAAREGAIL